MAKIALVGCATAATAHAMTTQSPARRVAQAQEGEHIKSRPHAGMVKARVCNLRFRPTARCVFTAASRCLLRGTAPLADIVLPPCAEE